MNILHQLAQSTYDYTTYTTTTTQSVDPATAAAASAMIAGFMLFSLFFVVIVYVFAAIFLGKIFKKAGVPAWVAWVPFYNNWKTLEIGGQQGFWAVLAIIPFVNIASAIFMYIAMYNIGLKLGKSGAFVALAIFLPYVWIVWLAVDKSVWNDSLGAPSRAPEHTGAGTTATPAV